MFIRRLQQLLILEAFQTFLVPHEADHAPL
jgi:hypothetical protein